MKSVNDLSKKSALNIPGSLFTNWDRKLQLKPIIILEKLLTRLDIYDEIQIVTFTRAR